MVALGVPRVGPPDAWVRRAAEQPRPCENGSGVRSEGGDGSVRWVRRRRPRNVRAAPTSGAGLRGRRDPELAGSTYRHPRTAAWAGGLSAPARNPGRLDDRPVPHHRVAASAGPVLREVRVPLSLAVATSVPELSGVVWSAGEDPPRPPPAPPARAARPQPGGGRASRSDGDPRRALAPRARGPRAGRQARHRGHRPPRWGAAPGAEVAPDRFQRSGRPPPRRSGRGAARGARPRGRSVALGGASRSAGTGPAGGCARESRTCSSSTMAHS